MQMPYKNQRLLTLDALRGIAAILVVIFHLRNAGLAQVKSGYLAVDIFFLLSGFVIAKTYESRLRDGLTIWKFALMRYIRLYPLFAIGLAFAIVQKSWQLSAGMPYAMSSKEILIGFAFELFLLPSPYSHDIYPLNPPGWSLFFEIIVNIIYASFLFNARLKALIALACLSGIGLAWLAITGDGINHGAFWEWKEFAMGMLRALFAFTVGAILARAHTSPARESRAAFLPMAVLFVLLWIPPRGDHWALYELTVVMIIAPALVWVGASFNPPRAFSNVNEAMGDLSYAIYVIHYPLIFMCGWAAASAGINRFIWMPIFLLVLVALAWSLHRYFDVPVRAWLTRVVRREYPKENSDPASAAIPRG